MSGESENMTAVAVTARMESTEVEMTSSGGNTSTSAITDNVTLDTTTYPGITFTSTDYTVLPTTANTETSAATLNNNASIGFRELTPQPKITTGSEVLNSSAEPTIQMTTKSSSTNQPTEFNMSSPSETTEFTTADLTPSTKTLIGGLEIWQLCVIIGAAALLVIAVAVTVCCLCRKKKNKKKQEQELRDMWTMGTGGVEINMVNMTPKVDRWKSTESVDQTVTTADVVEPLTVNVFNSSSDGNENGPPVRSLSRQNTATSINSRRSRGSVRSVNSDASSMFKKSKTTKILTKVEAPTINNFKQDGNEQSVSDLDETTDDGTDEKSPAESMISENPSTPKMETFRSQDSSPRPKLLDKSDSHSKSSSNPSNNNLSLTVPTTSPAASSGSLSEGHTNMNMSSFSQNKTGNRNSFLHNSYPNPIDLPSPPPPPPEEE